jgi:hypothetical protein
VDAWHALAIEELHVFGDAHGSEVVVILMHVEGVAELEVARAQQGVAYDGVKLEAGATGPAPMFLGLTPFLPVPGHTQVALNFPYGMYVLDIARQAFYLAPNLGCLCPPGFAASQIIKSQQCQPAPAGGYVDVLGRFVACPPGTFGVLSLATTQETCAPCWKPPTPVLPPLSGRAFWGRLGPHSPSTRSLCRGRFGGAGSQTVFWLVPPL